MQQPTTARYAYIIIDEDIRFALMRWKSSERMSIANIAKQIVHQIKHVDITQNYKIIRVNHF